MKKLLIAIVVPLLWSCSHNSATNNEGASQDHLIMATIWYQNAPEMKALYHQGFNLAKANVELAIKEKRSLPAAVVVDIDETMLDNSPFEAEEIIRKQGYTSEFWKEWTSMSKAKALPGAVEFSQFCKEKGVQLFYISNRKVDELAATIKNLDSLGFAYATESNVILRSAESSKKARRDTLSKSYDIVLLIGDNLNDFSEIFEERGTDWGSSLVEENKEEFGRKFIVLPNPMYGDWEKDLYGKTKLTEQQKDSVRRAVLVGF